MKYSLVSTIKAKHYDWFNLNCLFHYETILLRTRRIQCKDGYHTLIHYQSDYYDILLP